MRDDEAREEETESYADKGDDVGKNGLPSKGGCHAEERQSQRVLQNMQCQIDEKPATQRIPGEVSSLPLSTQARPHCGTAAFLHATCRHVCMQVITS